MSDPVILFVKPKAISPRDKKMLSNAGIFVVEIEDPQSVKLTRASAELTGTEMLGIAAKAIGQSTSAMDALGKAMQAALVAKFAPSTPAE